jgi:hypothetical protein
MLSLLQVTSFPSSPFYGVNLTTLTSDIVKILFLIAFGLYVIFAFIAVRQIEIMRKTVITPLSPLIQLIGYAHLIVAAGLLIFTAVYL